MTLTEGPFDYDVCLSFAGEQRALVEPVAHGLRERGVRVFYDYYEQATLWGKDLYEHLDWVYQTAAQYCVVFASADYENKVWTTHERRSAQARALQAKAEYILPVRVDDTQIPGIRPTVAYIDLRTTTTAELVDMIVHKVRSVGSSRVVVSAVPDPAVPSPTTTSRTSPPMAIALRPRSPDGPVEAHAHGRMVRAYLPLEGGGRLAFEADQRSARILADRLLEIATD